MAPPTHPPILITGSPRSGTTFLGKIFTESSEILYVHEPFNYNYGLTPITDNYIYIPDLADKGPFFKVVDRILRKKRLKYKFLDMNEKCVQNRRELFKDLLHSPFSIPNLLHFVWRLMFRSKTNFRYNFQRLFATKKRVLIKDPTICFSSEQLAQEHDFRVIVLIRHPLAYVSSMKRLGWGSISKRYLPSKSQLLHDELASYHTQILANANNELNPIQGYALDWNCCYAALFAYIARNPTMIPVIHEDLSLHPVETCRQLFRQLNLDFTPKIEQKIIELTTATNSAEARNNKAHDLHRNSKKLAKIWKKRLTPEEIRIIKEQTYDLASQYYTPESWL